MVDFNKFLKIERRLDTIIRFNAKTKIKDETVSEHSFHTALYAMILADMESDLGNKVDKEKVMKTALLHDLEESMTGDILSHFKHREKKLTEEIKKLSTEFLKELLSNIPEKLADEYLYLWENDKDPSSIEGRIIEAADKLEGLLYSIKELSLGNKSFGVLIDVYVDQLRATKLESVEIMLKDLELFE